MLSGPSNFHNFYATIYYTTKIENSNLIFLNLLLNELLHEKIIESKLINLSKNHHHWFIIIIIITKIENFIENNLNDFFFSNKLIFILLVALYIFKYTNIIYIKYKFGKI